jgi:hypothetical protein
MKKGPPTGHADPPTCGLSGRPKIPKGINIAVSFFGRIPESGPKSTKSVELYFEAVSLDKLLERLKLREPSELDGIGPKVLRVLSDLSRDPGNGRCIIVLPDSMRARWPKIALRLNTNADDRAKFIMGLADVADHYAGAVTRATATGSGSAKAWGPTPSHRPGTRTRRKRS